MMTDEYTLLRRRDVEEMVSISKSEIYRRIANGTFPKPIRLAPNMVRWQMKDVVTWLHNAANDNSNAVGRKVYPLAARPLRGGRRST